MKRLWTLKTPSPCGNNQKGYIALISVIIISALVLLIASSANLLSVSESDMGLQENQSWEAFYLATACAEEALQQIRDFAPFSGSGSLSLGQGTCTYTVIKLVGENRTIIASGTVGDAIRKIKITIDKINPDINIVSWQQVIDF